MVVVVCVNVSELWLCFESMFLYCGCVSITCVCIVVVDMLYCGCGKSIFFVLW